MTDKTLLYSQEAEEAMIGRILVNPADYILVDLETEDFYIHRYRMIWDAIGSMTHRNIGIDFVTLSEELDRRGQLSEIGGRSALAGLINSYPMDMSVEDSAAIIKDYAQRRAMIQVATDLVIAANNRREDASSRTAEFIDRLANLALFKHGAVPWSSYLSELWDDIEKRSKNPSETWGIPTGLSRFDRITGGVQRGESLIFSGKPGVGKSMLAMQMGRNMARSQPGAIYSVEMKGLQVARRFVSAGSRIPASRLKSGMVDADDWLKINKQIEELGALPVYMSDSSGWTTTALRADLARLKAVSNIQWFVFDYLMLASDSPGLDKTERSEIISRNMKLICKDLDLAGIVVHSMNKAGIDNARPDQANLSGSAQVAFDADLICFLTEFAPMSAGDSAIRPEDQKNMRTLFFAKGRELEDPQKYLHLVKNKEFPHFGDYMPERS